jgi:hypothetical protein
MKERRTQPEPSATWPQLLPPPTERDLPAGRREVLKEHLLQEFSEPSDADRPAANRWGRPRTAFIAAAAIIVLAAGVTTAALNGSAPHPAPPPTVHALATPAAELLDKIATTAAQQPAPDVHSGQFQYTDSEVAFENVNVRVGGKSTSSMEPLHRRQVWLSATDLCQAGLLREQGIGTSKLGPDGAACPDRGTLGVPTYELLASLPTDPGALLSLIRTKDQGQGPSSAAAEFITIGALLNESVAPPKISAALYRAAALIPGVTVVPHVQDAAGRHGVAVAFVQHSTRTEWIFNQTTLQLMGERDVDVATGAVTGTTAILHRAFVDRAGQLPPGQG